MIEVYTARDAVDARLMKELLESRGIRAVSRGEPLNVLGLQIPLGRVFPSVWVEESDFESARRIVDDFNRSLEREREDVASSGPWTCPECGEALEGQFRECWNCGTARGNGLAETDAPGRELPPGDAD